MALTQLKTGAIADDAVTTDKLANAINTERTANTAKTTNATHTGDVTGATGLTIADNAVTLAKMAGGTDGQIITYDASGDPVAVGPGTDGQVLTSTGAGSPPAFEAIPASGKILQVLQSTKTDEWSYTSAATAATDVSGTDQSGSGSVFCVKITPSATSSKILFSCNFTLGMGGGAAYVHGFMKRDSTTLLPGTHGTGNMVNCTFGRSGTGSTYYVENVGFTYLDSPNSTSELTYKVQFGKGDNSYEVYVNRPATLDNQPYNTCGSSTLTVMEIAG